MKIVGNLVFPTESSESLEEESFGYCSTPEQERGQCISLYSCDDLFYLFMKDPMTHSERDFLRRSQCGYLAGVVLVCCSTTSGSQSHDAESTDGENLLPEPGKCGVGTFDKMVGGKKPRIDEFPWTALLIYDKQNGEKEFNCGGVLINNHYVLTASHCVNGGYISSDSRLSSVRLGEWDMSTNIDCDDDDCSQPSIDILIEETIPHELYRTGIRSNLHDIALLRLSTPITYTDFIKPICLPLAEHLRDATFEGESLDVAGWGLTENGSKSKVKQKTTVKGANLNDCQTMYNGLSFADSGGPIVGLDKADRNRPYYFIAGIVSMGGKICGTEGFPSVYTRVGNYIDWIQSKIRP